MFTGGSGGDFLKMLCCRQLYPEFNFQLTPAGMIDFNDHYFKDNSQRFFEGDQSQLDYDRVHLVDNSHYYLENYANIADQLFFIDYPDSIVEVIVDIYIKKRFSGDLELFFNDHYSSLPETMKKYVNKENLVQISPTLWLKQLKVWRENTVLTPVQLSDFFNSQKLKIACETIMQSPIRDTALFDNDHNEWLEKNQKLIEIFTQ